MTPLESLFETDFDFIIKQSRKKTFAVKKTPVYTVFGQPRDFRVTSVFYPLIKITQLMGICPIRAVKDKKGHEFKFSWTSAPLLASALLFLFFGFLITMWILNVIINVDFPFRIFNAVDQEKNWISEKVLKGSELIIILNKLIRVSLPIGAWFQGILQWFNVRNLCQFLNDWPRFLQLFELTFSPYYKSKFNMKRTRNLMCFIWLAPVVILLIAMRPSSYFHGWAAVVGAVAGYVQVILVIGMRSISYIRDFLLLHSLSVSYEEILNGIKVEYSKCGKIITREQVRKWMELLGFVRKQATRVEHFLSLHNLWSIFEVFMSVLLILSMAVFLFMNNALGGTVGGNFLAFAIFSTSFFTISLYWKAYMAEDVSNKEEAIAEEIIEMETGDDDCETRLEMKLICDLIYNDPIKIRVGNMLTLNKRLLLAFFSQLASYLVVILQFTKT